MAAEQSVIPMLTYENGPAALDWLAEAFGFEERGRMLDAEGSLVHGEMLTGSVAGSGLIMLATATPAYESPRRHREHCERAQAWSSVPYIIDGVLVYVDDVVAHYTQAQHAGAVILSELEESGVGKRYRAEDLEGHRWMFMQR